MARKNTNLYCPDCGAELSRDANFCTVCGAYFGQSMENTITGAQKAARRRRKIAIICGIVVVAVAGIFIGLRIRSNKNNAAADAAAVRGDTTEETTVNTETDGGSALLTDDELAAMDSASDGGFSTLKFRNACLLSDSIEDYSEKQYTEDGFFEQSAMAADYFMMVSLMSFDDAEAAQDYFVNHIYTESLNNIDNVESLAYNEEQNYFEETYLAGGSDSSLTSSACAYVQGNTILYAYSMDIAGAEDGQAEEIDAYDFIQDILNIYDEYPEIDRDALVQVK